MAPEEDQAITPAVIQPPTSLSAFHYPTQLDIHLLISQINKGQVGSQQARRLVEASVLHWRQTVA